LEQSQRNRFPEANVQADKPTIGCYLSLGDTDVPVYPYTRRQPLEILCVWQ